MTIVTCPRCGAKNRVDEHRPAQLQPKCGRCGMPLAKAPSADAGGVLHLDDQNFPEALRNAGNTLMLVDCWADWCGPCRMLAPTIDELGKTAGGRWIIAKLNVDQSPHIASQYQVESIPTMLLFKNGQLVDRMIGLYAKPAIESRLAQLAADG